MVSGVIQSILESPSNLCTSTECRRSTFECVFFLNNELRWPADGHSRCYILPRRIWHEFSDIQMDGTLGWGASELKNRIKNLESGARDSRPLVRLRYHAPNDKQIDKKLVILNFVNCDVIVKKKKKRGKENGELFGLRHAFCLWTISWKWHANVYQQNNYSWWWICGQVIASRFLGKYGIHAGYLWVSFG